MTVVVPNVPTPVPSRADPVNFAARADAYHEALPNVVDAMNLQNAENNSLNSSTAALKAQTDAVAASVALTANVTAWNAVAVYVVGNCVFDPVDFLTYRRKTAGSSAVRPGLDATNWMLLTGFGDVTLTGTQTLTNKTLSLGSNTLSGTLSQFNSALSDADFATLAGNETLTNKTLSLGSNSLSGTLAQFNSSLSDADFATLAGNETLTNKTLTSPSLSSVTVTDGTANAILYLNGSKQLVSGSGLTFDGSNFGVGTSSLLTKFTIQDTERWELGGASGVVYSQALNAARTASVESRSYGSFLSWWVGASGSQLEHMRLDSSGNLGLGVTPSAWSGVVSRAFELPAGVAIASQNNANSAHITSNAYFNGTAWAYKSGGVAGRYTINPDGLPGFAWHTAPSGTAGQPISFTQAMMLDAGGKLMLGTTVPYTLITAEGGIRALANGTNGGLVVSSVSDTDSSRARITANGSDIVFGQNILTYPGAWVKTSVDVPSGGLVIAGSSLSFYASDAGSSSPLQHSRLKLDSSGNLLLGQSSNPIGFRFVSYAANNRLRLNHHSELINFSEVSFGLAGVENAAAIRSYRTSGTFVGNEGDLRFYTHTGDIQGSAAPERARIDSSGNLMVGTTSALNSSRLTVWTAYAGNIAMTLMRPSSDVTGSVDLNFAQYNSSAASVNYGAVSSAITANTAGSHSGALVFQTSNAGTLAERARIDSSGNLLVGGTQDEGAKAVFGNRSSTGTVVRVQTSNNGTESFCGLVTDGAGVNALLVGTQGLASSFAGGAQAGVVFTTQAKPLILGTSGTERARIDSSGNLLVGTTSAGGKFSVSQDAVAWARSTIHTNSGTQYFDSFGYGGTAIGTITGNNTTTSYNTSSDYRLKNITGPITTSGSYIDSLNPVEGTWKADGSTFVGLIAHEVQEASRTQVATGQKDGEQMQAMDYSNSELIANLIAEVKSLRARVAALETN